jgi:hypothetical protein
MIDVLLKRDLEFYNETFGREIELRFQRQACITNGGYFLHFREMTMRRGLTQMLMGGVVAQSSGRAEVEENTTSSKPLATSPRVPRFPRWPNYL